MHSQRRGARSAVGYKNDPSFKKPKKPKKPQMPQMPQLAYKPKDPSLGLFELLPTEIRFMIFETALEIDRPIKTRKCCGIFAVHKGLCPYHKKDAQIWSNHHKQKPSRFTLLSISHAVAHDASWVLHNKCTVHTNITDPMSINRKMWNSFTQYCKFELAFPGAIVRLAQPEHYLSGARDAVEKLIESWDYQDMNAPEEPTRAVTIHLDRLFNERLPFNLREDETQGEKEKARFREFECHMNLKLLVETIGQKTQKTKWTLTAMSELDKGNKGGQKALKTFQELLMANGIEFWGKTASEVPVPDTVESRGATGGTHRRFLD